MLPEIVDPVENVCGTITTSRIDQEQFEAGRAATGYGRLAALMSNNYERIDPMIEFVSREMAKKKVMEAYDSQYFDKRYGKFRNFWTRTIYLDPEKKKEMEAQRKLIGFCTSLGVEAALKTTARGVEKLLREMDWYKSVAQIYGLISSFAAEDDEKGDMFKAKVELGKIRNQLPLDTFGTFEKKRLMKAKPQPLYDIPEIAALSGENSEKIRESISFYLYTVYCQKYGEYLETHPDDPSCKKLLMTYYDYLGYSGKTAEELFRDNAEACGKIADEQAKYLGLSRAMVRKVFTRMPEIDIDRLNRQADEMAKYDPYSIRRKKVQTAGLSAAVTVAGIFARSPSLVIQGGATALAQLQLEGNDNLKEFLFGQLKEAGLDLKAFNAMLEQSKNIRLAAKKMV